MSAPPILFKWDGESFAPLNQRFAREADKHYVVGETYQLLPQESRSLRSHNHYFSCLHDAWLTLPEDQAERFPTADHLRKWCLIRAGYLDERSIVCASKAEAARVAAFVRPMDGFAVVTVREAVVTVCTARSQSMKAMGRAEFQKSKDDVLAILDDMLGTSRGTVAHEAGRAA